MNQSLFLSPIVSVILKDVSYSVMTELLQFMYQGEVNVKHTELQAFMKIAEMLQIKGLTTPSSQRLASPHHLSHRGNGGSGVAGNSGNGAISGIGATSGGGRQSPQQTKGIDSPQMMELKSAAGGYGALNKVLENASSNLGAGNIGSSSGQKRQSDFPSDVYAMYAKKQPKRSMSDINESSSGTHEMTNDSMDNMGDEVFMPPIPQISMGEGGRFDLNNVKRENPDMPGSPVNRSGVSGGPNSSGSSFSYDFNNGGSGGGSGGPSSYQQKPMEYNNETHESYNINKGSHMDIPPGKKFLLDLLLLACLLDYGFLFLTFSMLACMFLSMFFYVKL